MKKKGLMWFLDRCLVLYLPLIIMIIFIMGPFYWCVITTFKLESDIIVRPINYWPPTWTLENIIYSWNTVGFSQYFMNSFIVSISATLCIVILSVLVSYPMTRFKFRGSKVTLLLLLATQFLPHAMLLIPLFIIFKNLGLINTLGSVILAVITFQTPYNTVLMTGFMSGVPVEIEEAAMIDGCNRMQSIIRVVFPILIPGIVAAGSFAFVSAWKEYLFTLMFINSPAKQTISVGLSSMLSEFSVKYGLLAAGCTIAMIPPVLIFAYIQKYLVGGLASGAVKG